MALFDYSQLVKNVFLDSAVEKVEVVQSLWSGYGEISRFKVTTSQSQTVFCILKYVNLKKISEHPRGWNGAFAHNRKIQSYINEMNFYQQCANSTNNLSRVPKLYAADCENNFIWLLMEDLDFEGFHYRISSSVLQTNDNDKMSAIQSSHLNKEEIELTDIQFLKKIRSTIKWLAIFHSNYINHIPVSLSMTGTYWHLSTRPDELNKMADNKLKSAASKIDLILKQATFQTLLHGDAKIANFCFSELENDNILNHDRVAAVDFQYAGKGVGVKDLIYFLGSCFDERHLFIYANELIDYYFQELKISIKKQSTLSNKEVKLLEKEWRNLLCFAWADFERFLQGWAPRHPKLNGYSGLQTKEALNTLFKPTHF